MPDDDLHDARHRTDSGMTVCGNKCFDLGMETGMNRHEAESLAEAVRDVCRHPAHVVADESYYAIEVRVQRGDSQDIFMLRDESDWAWLRERIGRRD